MSTDRPLESALRRRKTIFFCALAATLFLAGLAVFCWNDIVQGFTFLGHLKAQKDRFRDWVNSFGLWGPLVFIGVQIGQVVFSPIPGELTGFLGGYIYGVWVATIYSTVGLTLGSYLAFAIGRWLGRPFVEKLIPRPVLEKFDFLVSNKGALFAFIFFSIPGFPKDYMCYLLGLSPLSVRTFMIVATIGRIPGTLVLGLQGANLYNERYELFFILMIGILIAGALAAYFKETILEWVRGRADRAGSGREG